MKKSKLSRIAALLAAGALLVGGMFMSCSIGGDDDDDEETEDGKVENPETPTSGGDTIITGTITAPSATSTTDVNPDADIVVSTSSLPSTVTIYNGETLVDTILSTNEKLYTGTGSGVGTINVKDQLVQLLDGVVIVKPHFDSTGHGSLSYNTTYTVKFDDADVLTFTTRESAPTISNNTINVGSSSDSDFATIQGAFNYIAKNDTEGGNWTINVAAGSYHERLYYKGSANVTLVGPEDSGENAYGDKAVVYWKNNEAWNSGTRIRTNFLWEGANLTLKNLTFKSTYLRTVDGASNNDSTEVMYFDSKSYLVANNCSFLGHQDTLILGNSGGRAWFYQDYIEGDVDFIWGNIDVALFEECQIHMTDDDGVDTAYIFASRTVTSNEVNKGFVLYNSNVSVDDGVAAKAYYGRNMGSETQASVINSTFDAVNSNLWLSSGSDVSDIAGDAAIAFKDYGNKLSDGTAISTDNRSDKTYTLSERVVNREYNGRWVILNRGYDSNNEVYKTASSIWDVSSYEQEFGATEDVSKSNIFVEPVYYAGLVKDATTTLKVYDVNGNEVTDGITWSTNSDAATVDGGIVTGTATKETLVNITAASSSHSDYAIVQSILESVASTAIDFTAPTSLVLDDSYYITATLTPETEGKSVTNRTVTWTASEGSGILFKNDSSNTAVSTITTSVGSDNTTVVGIYANGTDSGTITGTVNQDSGVAKTSGTISISATEKTIGTISSTGYKFSISGYDTDSPDNLFNGTSKYKGDVNHNVFWTSDKSKVATVLKWDKELTLTSDYIQIKGNGSKGISYTSGTEATVTKWNPAADGYDAIKLAGVTGPFKVTANVAGQVGSDRALVIRVGSTDKTFVLTKSATSSATAKAPYACTVTYGETDSVDVFITSSNDVRIGSIELASYDASAVAITASDFASATLSLDLNGTKESSSQTITATASDNSAVTIAYSSSHEKVATVDSTGKVTAVGIGRSVITATASATGAESVEKTYVVTVKNSAEPTADYSIDLASGDIYDSTTVTNDVDLGIVYIKSGNSNALAYHGSQHGIYFKQGNNVTLAVKAGSVITLTNCAYDTAYTISVTSDGTIAVTDATVGGTNSATIASGVVSIPAGDKSGDGKTTTITIPASYTGTSVTLTHTGSNSGYLHKIDVTISSSN